MMSNTFQYRAEGAWQIAASDRMIIDDERIAYLFVVAAWPCRLVLVLVVAKSIPASTHLLDFGISLASHIGFAGEGKMGNMGQTKFRNHGSEQGAAMMINRDVMKRCVAVESGRWLVMVEFWRAGGRSPRGQGGQDESNEERGKDEEPTF